MSKFGNMMILIDDREVDQRIASQRVVLDINRWQSHHDIDFAFDRIAQDSDWYTR